MRSKAERLEYAKGTLSGVIIALLSHGLTEDEIIDLVMSELKEAREA